MNTKTKFIPPVPGELILRRERADLFKEIRNTIARNIVWFFFSFFFIGGLIRLVDFSNTTGSILFSILIFVNISLLIGGIQASMLHRRLYFNGPSDNPEVVVSNSSDFNQKYNARRFFLISIDHITKNNSEIVRKEHAGIQYFYGDCYDYFLEGRLAANFQLSREPNSLEIVIHDHKEGVITFIAKITNDKFKFFYGSEKTLRLKYVVEARFRENPEALVDYLKSYRDFVLTKSPIKIDLI